MVAAVVIAPPAGQRERVQGLVRPDVCAEALQCGWPERQKEQAVSDAGPNHAEGGDQGLPGDHPDSALTSSAGRRSARPVREFRMTGADRVGNPIFSVLAQRGDDHEGRFLHRTHGHVYR